MKLGTVIHRRPTMYPRHLKRFPDFPLVRPTGFDSNIVVSRITIKSKSQHVSYFDLSPGNLRN